jgi:cell division protein FtsL
VTRLNIVLLLAVMASALYLVRVQYDSRRLYFEIEKAAAESRKLETDHERLQAEKRAQATPLRVERLAKEQLQMRPAGPGITQYVSAGAAPGAPSAQVRP